VKPHLAAIGRSHASQFQQVKRPVDIGADELRRSRYRAVNVGFGGQVNNTRDVVRFETFFKAVEITDIDLFKTVIGRVLDLFQAGEIPGVGETVKIDKQVVGVFRHQVEQQVGADKPAAARDQDALFECSFFFLSRHILYR